MRKQPFGVDLPTRRTFAAGSTECCLSETFLFSRVLLFFFIGRYIRCSISTCIVESLCFARSAFHCQKVMIAPKKAGMTHGR